MYVHGVLVKRCQKNPASDITSCFASFSVDIIKSSLISRFQWPNVLGQRIEKNRNYSCFFRKTSQGRTRRLLQLTELAFSGGKLLTCYLFIYFQIYFYADPTNSKLWKISCSSKGYPTLSYPFPFHLIPSHPIPSHSIPSHLIPSHPILSYPILSYPILSYPILSYPILSNPILSYPIPSHPILSYPILTWA